MASFSTFIFVAVMMIAVGYITAKVRNFNIWKMLLIGFVAAPIVTSIGSPGAVAWTAVIAFFVGYLLPQAHFLYDISDAISDVINGVRYRDDRENISSQKEELRRKEEELRRREEALEQLRRQYEEAMRNARQSRSGSEEKAKSRTSSDQKQERQQSSGAGSSSKNKATGPKSKRTIYLEILELDPSKTYTKSEISKRFKELVHKCHPDKHQGESEEEIKRLTEKMRKLIEANNWFKKNPDE